MKIFICIFSVLLSCLMASADQIEVNFSGEKRVIRTEPHVPYLIIGSLEQLKQHYSEVKNLLPPMPFLMEGKWVIPGQGETFRTFPRNPAVREIFSPNGDYIVTTELEEAFEFPRYSKMTLMTTDGTTLWQKEQAPPYALVTNDGRVIGRSQYNENLSLTFFGRDGEEIKQVKEVFQPGLAMPYRGNLRLIPSENLLLAREFKQLTALNYDGEVLWRYTVPKDVPKGMIFKSELDPLGRGIYIQIGYGDNTSSVYLVDVKTGDVTGSIWENKTWILSDYFSPSGEYMAIAYRDELGLLNWRTGEMLFLNKNLGEVAPLLQGKEVYVTAGGADVSDAPPSFVVPLADGLGTCIIGATGQIIWRCDIRSGYARNFLSADGKTLSIVSTRPSMSEPEAVEGLLLYKVEPSVNPQ